MKEDGRGWKTRKPKNKFNWLIELKIQNIRVLTVFWCTPKKTYGGKAKKRSYMSNHLCSWMRSSAFEVELWSDSDRTFNLSTCVLQYIIIKKAEHKRYTIKSLFHHISQFAFGRILVGLCAYRILSQKQILSLLLLFLIHENKYYISSI